MSIFMESWAPNPDFGQNHVFAVREQLHRFRTTPTPDSDSTWSKVPPAIWNLVFVFDRMCATPFFENLKLMNFTVKNPEIIEFHCQKSKINEFLF